MSDIPAQLSAALISDCNKQECEKWPTTTKDALKMKVATLGGGGRHGVHTQKR